MWGWPVPAPPEITSYWRGRWVSPTTSISATAFRSAPNPAWPAMRRPARGCWAAPPGRKATKSASSSVWNAYPPFAATFAGSSDSWGCRTKREKGGVMPTRAKDAARPVGLLAGSGRFPITFAEKAREIGLPVVCVGLKDIAPPELRSLVHRFHWSGAIQIGRMIRLFKREGVRHLVMAGKVPKADLMHNPWNILTLLPDLRALRLWYFGRRRDNRDNALLL